MKKVEKEKLKNKYGKLIASSPGTRLHRNATRVYIQDGRASARHGYLNYISANEVAHFTELIKSICPGLFSRKIVFLFHIFLAGPGRLAPPQRAAWTCRPAA